MVKQYKLYKLFTIGMLGLSLLTSCSHYYYAPSQQNIPLFREQGECRLNASYGVAGGLETETDDEKATTIDAQAAYAFSNKFAAAVNYQKAYAGSGSTSGNVSFLEGSLGIYKVYGVSVFECYAGVGSGNQHHQYSQNYFADLTHWRFFIQPSYGWKYNAIEVAYSARFSDVYFNRISGNAYEKNTNNLFYSDLKYIDEHRNSFLLEPAITFRVGWKAVKLQIQGSYSFNLSNPDMDFYHTFLNTGIIIGLPYVEVPLGKIERNHKD